MKLKEIKKLPDLVDGRDIFLQRGEEIQKAIVLSTGEHVYVSMLKPRKRGKMKLYSTFKAPEVPSERWATWMPDDQLKFYK